MQSLFRCGCGEADLTGLLRDGHLDGRLVVGAGLKDDAGLLIGIGEVADGGLELEGCGVGGWGHGHVEVAGWLRGRDGGQHIVTTVLDHELFGSEGVGAVGERELDDGDLIGQGHRAVEGGGEFSHFERGTVRLAQVQAGGDVGQRAVLRVEEIGLHGLLVLINSRGGIDDGHVIIILGSD